MGGSCGGCCLLGHLKTPPSSTSGEAAIPAASSPLAKGLVTGGRNLSQFQVSGPVSPKGAFCSTIYMLQHTFGLVWLHNEAACTG